MERGDLYRSLQDSGSLTGETLGELRRIMHDHPYFQAARMLYLKNLVLRKDPTFVAELEKMAIYCPDRKKLYLLLEGEELALLLKQDAKPTEETTDSFSLIDAFLSTKEEERKRGKESPLLFQPTISSDYLSWSLSQATDEPLAEEPANPLKHQDLIDSFIANERQHLQGNGMKAQEELSEPEPSELPEDHPLLMEGSYLTETLAHIYIKQKRYEKALQIIKSLNLKYPEKNIYFADQIRFLEKLIINTKK